MKRARIQRELREIIFDIERNPVFKRKGVTVFNNAPTALMQSRMDGELGMAKRILKLLS